MTIEKLIRVFKVSEPYELEYHYRTRTGREAYSLDKPLLDELMNQGLVKLVYKTSKTILFRYLGK